MLLAIVLTGVFASFYGGNLAYAMFYFTLTVPVVSLIYTVFVFSRFKLSQETKSWHTLKGEYMPFDIRVANEDFIAYTGIKLNFLTENSNLSGIDMDTTYMLLPQESVKINADICCKYRGEYEVGVGSVEVTDFLRIFSITYPMLTKKRLSVLPKLIPLERLVLTQNESDTKQGKATGVSDTMVLDVNMKKYSVGDSRKLIHWKASARRGELMSRTYSIPEKLPIAVLADLSPLELDKQSTINVEDKIIDVLLSVSDLCLRTRTKFFTYLDFQGESIIDVDTSSDFEQLYHLSSKLKFNSKKSASMLLTELITVKSEAFLGIIVTTKLTHDLLTACKDAVVANDVKLTVIYIGSGSNVFADELVADGINVLRVEQSEDIIRKLNGYDIW